METKVSFTLKDLITIGTLLVTLASAFFGLKNEIKQSQLKTENQIQQMRMIQQNDVRVLELKFASLQLQVAKLETTLQTQNVRKR